MVDVGGLEVGCGLAGFVVGAVGRVGAAAVATATGVAVPEDAAEPGAGAAAAPVGPAPDTVAEQAANRNAPGTPMNQPWKARERPVPRGRSHTPSTVAPGPGPGCSMGS